MTTLEKAAELLDVLAADGRPLRLIDLAELLGMPKSSTHRLVSALGELGVVRRDPLGLYTLGPRVVAWGARAVGQLDIRDLCEDILRSFNARFGESVNLHVARGDDRVCVAAVRGRFSLVPSVAVGSTRPIGSGAAGRVLLAWADPAARGRALERQRAADRPVPTAADLAVVRAERWAVVRDELELGLTAAAAPVLGVGGLLGAVTIGGASARLTDELLESVRRPLQDCADELAAAMETVPRSGELLAAGAMATG